MNGIERLAVLDVDNTLSDGYHILKFAYYLSRNGSFPKPLFNDMVTTLKRYTNGKINYEKFAKDWVDSFGRGIEGQDSEMIRDAGWGYNRKEKEGYPGKFRFTDDLVRLLNDEGFTTLAVSGSPDDVVLPFSEIAGIQRTLATAYEKEDRIYTGKVRYTPVGRSKMNEIRAFLSAECRLPAEQMAGILSASAGFGDSVHDDFLHYVGHPFVINPRDEMEGIAAVRGWPILNVFEDPMLNVPEIVKQRISMACQWVV